MTNTETTAVVSNTEVTYYDNYSQNKSDSYHENGDYSFSCDWASSVDSRDDSAYASGGSCTSWEDDRFYEDEYYRFQVGLILKQ